MAERSSSTIVAEVGSGAPVEGASVGSLGSMNSMRRLSRTLSLSQGAKTIKVTIEAPTLGPSPMRAESGNIGKIWQRRVLTELQDRTNFSTTELEVLLNHFMEHQTSDDHLDRATFLKCLGTAFATSEEKLLEHLFIGMDAGGCGYVNFKQFVCALSTVFRGTKDEVLRFWFAMYDRDHDGYLSKRDFCELLEDINNAARKAVSVYVEQIFDDPDCSGAPGEEADELLLSFDDFALIMEEHDVIPTFVNPHKSALHKQPPAFRAMSPEEREVISLLGSELNLQSREELIREADKLPFFYFLLEGSVELVRDGVSLGEQTEGSFVGEAALFQDVKQADEQGNVSFTTSVRVCSDSARILRMNIHDFYPLVYHEHPGATAIVQRLGRVMLERFQQTEERLQKILSQQERQSQAGMRLSSKDWAAFRSRLTKLWALRYHKIGRKGKLEVLPTKMMGTKEDLSVAYSPGVAEPCVAIQQNERWAYEYTAKGHLVGVITNGTAVLGLGNIGALAGKPVMEGKAVLFKKFADLDAFDIEVNQDDAQKLVDIVVALEPTFGGVNLEDIKAPECFYVERECQRRMNIPVFHDDQHGTAIIAGAGLLNALQLVNKNIGDIKVVVCGCGAAGYTCATYFVTLGVARENLLALDVQGVVYKGRADLEADPDSYLHNVAVDTPLRTLKEAVAKADVFLGLSAGNLLSPEMLLSMARDPVVFACANPTPEIDPDLARATREDVIVCTGRSDFPNQINNVCAFPYIFRGALDCRAKKVNEEMKLAATYAIAGLAKRPPTSRREQQPQQQAGEGLSSNSLSMPDLAASGQQGQQGDGLARKSNPSSSPRPGTCVKKSASDHELMKHLHKRHVSGGASSHDLAAQAAAAAQYRFGRDYIIPKPFDERLLPEVASAVVRAAIETGVARLADINVAEYKRDLCDLSHKLSM